MTIQQLLKNYETALNAGDIEGILALYGSDPVFMPQHAPALVGVSAVRAGYEQVFATLKLDIQFSVYEIEEAGDWAWARTSSAGRTRILAPNIEVTEGNNELFVFRREAGEWRIHRYLFSTNQPRACEKSRISICYALNLPSTQPRAGRAKPPFRLLTRPA